MRIYTRKGDGGDTDLFGGKRVRKDSLRITACGAVDELNSALGLAIAENLPEDIAKELINIQSELFELGADLAAIDNKHAIFRVHSDQTTDFEEIIDRYDNELEPLKHFILPGGSKGSAALHLARSICRRAERDVITLASTEAVNPNIPPYLNRLSDLLFTLARAVNKRNGIADTQWAGLKKARNQKEGSEP